FFSSLGPSVVRMGLDRIHSALDALGRPERSFPILHVAGTNGKGSTCAFAAASLAAQGYRVGLYTSPHLVAVNERVRVDGTPVSDDALARRILEVLERYPEAASDPPPLTFFELGTLVAFWHFAQEEVDVAVVETGLGGRLDATSAARPAVTAITPVSMDHTEYLGHTLSAIAREKAGIFKSGVPAVSSRQAPEALRVLEEIAREVGTSLKVEGRDFSLTPENTSSGALGTYRGMRTSVPGLSLGLQGAHQWQNAAVALAALELLEDQGLRLSAESARKGLAEVQWPGRLEVVAERPTVLVDGAHNPAAVEALATAVATLYPNRPIHLVFGLFTDKDRRPMLRALFPRCASAWLARPDNPRGLEPERYWSEARELCPQVQVARSVAEAVAQAQLEAGPDGLVLATGSLSVVGEVKRALGT
ncbi:MAG TPA: folylpolyglutamate synthase/dihydrofolate synthase family protein, partial [Myxococcaceae bacterium]|nr:folylpolyglutamate synthase/dihydrofolate synthase family protein [Myxococcaceae bacterium]